MSRDQFNQYDAERLPLNNPSHGHFLDPRNHKTPEFLSEFRGFGLYQYGGEGGIRTLDTISCIHTFQACSLSHSDTSPYLDDNVVSAEAR